MANHVRAHDRVEIFLPVVVIVGDREVKAHTRNISLGGVFIETTDPPPFGAEVKIRLRFPSQRTDSTLVATVRWVEDGGFGAHFGSLRAIDTWAINQIAKAAANG